MKTPILVAAYLVAIVLSISVARGAERGNRQCVLVPSRVTSPPRDALHSAWRGSSRRGAYRADRHRSLPSYVIAARADRAGVLRGLCGVGGA